jgi:hypothetical protein
LDVHLLSLFARRASAWTGSLLLCLLGCKTPKGLPEDPLFLSRTPIEVKAHAGAPVQQVSTEPAIPAYPLAMDPAQPRGPSDSQPTRKAPSQPTDTRLPVQALPSQQ